MIAGVGTDIVEIARIQAALARHGEAFSRRVLTDEELAELGRRAAPDVFLAGRWAAKEAVSKALGVGIGEACAWRDIHVRNDSRGRAHVTLSGDAGRTAAGLGVRRVHVSISHEREYACATAILESADPVT